MSEFKKLTDPDILDKIRSEIEYLDEMIRGEQTNVIAYECKNKQFQRIDNFGMAEKREKRLVAIENEIIRLKMKIMRRQHYIDNLEAHKVYTDQQERRLKSKEERLRKQLEALGPDSPK